MHENCLMVQDKARTYVLQVEKFAESGWLEKFCRQNIGLKNSMW